MFSTREGNIGGDACILITPNDITCKWTEETLQYRSIIIRKSDSKIISRGFSKFFNWSEQPDLNKFPYGSFEAIEKIDGSLIIWGIHNGELIHRTRGTFNLITMPNGNELEFLKNKYPNLINGIKNNQDYSILTEWETKTNVIVINRVLEPTLTLVGMIHNESGILKTQLELDALAKDFGLNRPVRYQYDSIPECIDDVQLWNNKEGVVLYSEDGQFLRKCKSDWYLALHKIRTGFTTIKHVLEVFMESPKYMNQNDFYDYMVRVVDYEVAEKCKDFIGEVCKAYTYFINTEMFIRSQVDIFVRPLETRKDQAMALQQQFSGWMLSYSFQYLDYKSFSDKQLTQVLKSILHIGG